MLKKAWDPMHLNPDQPNPPIDRPAGGPTGMLFLGGSLLKSWLAGRSAGFRRPSGVISSETGSSFSEDLFGGSLLKSWMAGWPAGWPAGRLVGWLA